MAETNLREAPASNIPLAGAAACFGLALVAAGSPPTLLNAVAALVLNLVALVGLHRTLLGRAPKTVSIVVDALVIAAVVIGREPAAALWSAPGAWLDMLRVTPIGAATLLLCYGAAATVATVRLHRHLALREQFALLLVPVLFNLVLALGADALTRGLGRTLLAGLPSPDWLAGSVGRAVLLIGFLELLAGLLRILVAGRLSGHWRLHAVLILAALLAAATPVIATLPEPVAQMGGVAGAILSFLAAILSAGIAQAGLWAIVYVVTGLSIDSIHGTPPIPSNARSHWRAGLVKGGIYGSVFMGLLLAVDAIIKVPGVTAVARTIPLLAGPLIGAALFPLAQTIIGSADGTPPFFGRLKAAYKRQRGYARGLVVGLGVAVALTAGLPGQDGLVRFLSMFAVGALAYAGVDLAADTLRVWRAERRFIQDWHVYALGVLLGGLVGGALGWYFDAVQIGVVVAKFFAYVDLDYRGVGRAVNPYGTTPLFNKYGTIDLGAVQGGVRLFFNESLAGTINWSIAAPLFSVNFFVLLAILDRSLTPLKRLFSAAGFQSLVEQAVRVLGWGLWMAPVINSFLRQSPDPSWYNQDGAIRTLVATGAEVFLPAHDFRLWSLAVFTGLLAYDWLRILIWFDHMGLRVATLVNLTFIGGDRVDEAAARFTGHSGRTRVIPDSIRRFATWAPLIIPFYIPRNAEWDQAWTGAEQIRNNPGAIAAPVWVVFAAYAVAAVLGALAGVAVHRAWRGRVLPPGPQVAGVPQTLLAGRESFSLANGFMRTELMADGRGHATVEGAARGGAPLDISRQPDDALQITGPFLIIADQDAPEPWSLGYEPMRVASADYRLAQPEPGCIQLHNGAHGVTMSARISLADDSCLERWRIAITNTTASAKTLRLTSFRELAMHNPGIYLRDPDFNGMHVETTFLRGLNAIFARNRLLKNSVGHMSHETGFHAVRLGEAAATLVGYEDSRTRFLGPGGIRRPSGLERHAPRSPSDEGALYSFDPAASLTVSLELGPGERTEIVYLTGHAIDEAAAALIVAREIGVNPLSEGELRNVLYRQRALDPGLVPPAETWPFHFAEPHVLHLTEKTPRPWAHVMANPLGFGTVVSNEGEVHSYMANERQNALTPFRFESTPTAVPGQLVYVVDLETGTPHTAGFVPYRREDATYDVTYELGSATFRMQRGDIELELRVFVVPLGRCDCRILTIRNNSDHAKRYRVVPYFDMVLDQNASDSVGKLEVVRDEATEALLFSNPKNDFHRGWAFAATSLQAPMVETVRARFVGGVGRDLVNPAMVETGFPDGSAADDGRRVAAFCGEVDVPAGQSLEVAIVLGQTASQEEALAASNLRDPVAARAAYRSSRSWWAERLGGIQVETNDPAFDRLVNVWLPYQALAARIWGRTGPNQRGGAFGYRDQLQDVLPFLFLDPHLARRQIVLHAAQQFREGDTLKWWHVAPDGKTGLGQRTTASDPHLWLPYVTARYLEATGDRSVLDEVLPYLEAPRLPPGSIDMLVNPSPSRETDTLLGHCQRAIDYTLARMGAHGLPLVGSGDWNDGIDEAGRHGRGESTWLACFLYDVLTRFGPQMGTGQEAVAARYAEAAATLKSAINGVWRGDHYTFMFSDDGDLIDRPSIMTSAWPALSGAADDGRGIAALEAGLRHLERQDRILLVTPPFDENSDPYPGRIAEYPPGVRENGGQYTHGATWTVDAFMRLAEQAKLDGIEEATRHFTARAVDCWTKISPIGKTEGEALAIYGLAPHQQPADIYDGPEYGGRGGWSWYSGSAARMLSAAYAILGLRMKDGQCLVPDDLFTPKGPLEVKRLVVNGTVYEAKAESANLGTGHGASRVENVVS
ncbi:GH36-type glycosyl hydrolase domain-containing protein [Lichenifustis flavocetrariae]|uniref:Glycosyl transferase family 36 n=1 Tax=Lichenifustis flavocetrariae TaxID=2949735 RepID=A0AA42CJZ2_9HYPH|nr:glycosyl transferase family 36 [Lichenifustis flavocetrariae]MCW6508626.1 glycosyl transferase family 36 [Lichenifustis flavocetrariae]